MKSKKNSAEARSAGSSARSTRTFGRFVAIKILTAESDADLLARFRTEAATAGNLTHKNIVTVHECGEQDGMPYLVMELLEGETLEHVISSARELSLLEKLDVILQVAEGLRWAHSKNVIHRDIKPANIMLLPNGLAKIMDFGVARVMGTGSTRRTHRGSFLGTPSYMSPEQLLGGDADRQTDIFAFGVVCYELLTGLHPFNAREPQAVMYRIMSIDPDPVRNHLPECPQPLDDLVMRQLVRDRSLRLQTLDDVVFDVTPIIQQLRQQKASAIIEAIRPALEGGDFSSAEPQLRQARDLDPLNNEARDWHRRIQDAAYAQAIRQRVATLLNTAEEKKRGREFPEAVQQFEAALALDKSDTTRILLEQARSALLASRNSARLTAEARWERQRDNLTLAHDRANEAVAADPGNEEASALRDELRALLDDRRADEALKVVERCVAAADYLGALAALDSQTELVSKGAIARMYAVRSSVIAAQAESDRQHTRQRVRSSIRDIETALAAHVPGAPERLLYELECECEGDAEFQPLIRGVADRIRAVRRDESIAAVARQGRQLLNDEDALAAQALLERSLQTWPDASVLQDLLGTALSVLAKQQRERALASAVQRADGLMASGEIEQALLAIEDAVATHGECVEIIECRRNILAQRDQRDHRAAIEKAISEAENLIALNRADEGTLILERVRSQYPDEPKLSALLGAARQLQAEVAKVSFVRQAIERAGAAEGVNDVRTALIVIDEAMARYPDVPELSQEATRLHEWGRARSLQAHKVKIDEAVRSRDWIGARRLLQSGLDMFPGEVSLAPYSDRIAAGQRTDNLRSLEAQIRQHFIANDLLSARTLLKAAPSELHEEPIWQSLTDELANRERYESALGNAEQLRAATQYEAAGEIVNKVIREYCPDRRAAELLDRITADRQHFEREQIDDERRAIRGLLSPLPTRVTYEDLSRAMTALERSEALCARFGGNDEVLPIHDAVAAEVNRRKAQYERQQEIEAGRGRAAELAQSNQHRRALELIDELRRHYPDSQELKQDRDAIQAELRKLEAQRRRVQAIELARKQASELVRKEQYRAALEVLANAAAQNGVSDELARDRDAIQLKLNSIDERRAREARIAGEAQSIRDHLTRGQPEEADAALKRARAAFPEEGVWAALQKEIEAAAEARRAAVAAAEERRLVKSALAEAQSFEVRRLWRKGIETLELALARNPQNADLQNALRRIKAGESEEERRRRLEEHRARVEAALSAKDLPRATAALADARQDLPGEALFDVFEERLKRALLDAALVELAERVQSQFAADDLAAAARELEDARGKYGQQRRWQDLDQELRARRAYLIALSEAQHLLAAGELERAERELRKLIAGGAIDERASQMLGEVLEGKIARVIQAAEGALGAEKAGEALALLDQFRSVPSDRRAADIDALRKQAERQIQENRERERLKKRTELDQIAETVRSHIVRDDVQRAVAELQIGESQYPGEELWPALRAEIAAREKELGDFNQERARARDLLASAPAEGVALLERLRSRYPARDKIATDLDSAREQLREHQFRTLVREVEELCAKGRFAEAHRRVAVSTPKHPGLPGLGERILALEEEARSHRLAGELEAAREIRSKNPRGALQRLEKVRVEFAGRAEFEEAVDECRRALENGPRENAVREVLGPISIGPLLEKRSAPRVPFRTALWVGGGVGLAAIVAAAWMLSRGAKPSAGGETSPGTRIVTTPPPTPPDRARSVAPPPPSTVAEGPRQGVVIVYTIPAAEVFVDGQLAGQTNAQGTARFSAELGPHSIRVSKAGFVAAEKTTTVQAGSRRLYMELKQMQAATAVSPERPAFTPPPVPASTRQQETSKLDIGPPPKIPAGAGSAPDRTVAILQPRISVPQPRPESPPVPQRAPEKPPAPAPTQGTSVGDAEAIGAVLNQYAAAFKAKNFEELKRVFPAAATKSLQQGLRDPRSSVLDCSLNPTSEPVIRGDVASVNAVQIIQWRGQSESRKPLTAVLHREHGHWIITEFRY